MQTHHWIRTMEHRRILKTTWDQGNIVKEKVGHRAMEDRKLKHHVKVSSSKHFKTF
jgi:hypothetical protein